MTNSIIQYGHALQSAGGNLVYISNEINSRFTDNGVIQNPEQSYLDLKDAVNTAQSSVQCLENIIPPSFLDIEHKQLVDSFQRILKCINNLFNTESIDDFLKINEAQLTKNYLSLKQIEAELNQTTLKVIEKMRLQSSR